MLTNGLKCFLLSKTKEQLLNRLDILEEKEDKSNLDFEQIEYIRDILFKSDVKVFIKDLEV